MPFQLLSEYPYGTTGNACLTCHTQKMRPDQRLIDLGVSTDGIVDIDGNREIREGYAVICETCVAEIAHMLGWQTDDISDQLRAMRGEIGTLRQELQGYQDLRSSVNKLARR